MKVGLIKQILMDGFSGILDNGWVEDNKIRKGKSIHGKKQLVGFEVNQSRSLDASSKFDNYSISHKIEQTLLRWSYELTEKDFPLI